MSDRRNDSATAADRPSRLRRVPAAIVYLCLVSAGVLAAWQAHRHWLGPGGGPPAPAQRDGQFGADARGDWATTSPYQMMKDPLSAAGIRPLEGDPCDVQPPPGAERRSAFQRGDADAILQHASYHYDGDQAAAAEHYIQTLLAAGFELLNDSTKKPDLRMIVARRESLRLIVLLRKNKTADNMVQISVTAIRDDSREHTGKRANIRGNHNGTRDPRHRQQETPGGGDRAGPGGRRPS